MAKRLLFLNSHRAKSGTVDGLELHRSYVLFARLFGCGPIDRTGTLEIGVDVAVADPIPEASERMSFREICDVVAADLVDEAVRADQAIQVAWSGGIDSTLALIVLARHLRERGELQRLWVLLSLESMREHPRFYEAFVAGRLQVRPLAGPLPEALRTDALTVTGEHGDQLFGSDHLAGLVEAGVSQLPHAHVVPVYFAQRLRSEAAAAEVLDYLAPQVAAAPVPIETAFEYLWWCNFSLKWQQVSLRVPVFRLGRVEPFCRTTRHFFGDRRFQAWSLASPGVRRVDDWGAYKLEAKKLILEATDDLDYFAHKRKAPSLKRVLIDRARQGDERYRIHMYDDFEVHREVFQRTPGRQR